MNGISKTQSMIGTLKIFLHGDDIILLFSFKRSSCKESKQFKFSYNRKKLACEGFNQC